MKNALIPFALAAAMVSTPAVAAEVQVQSQGPVVELSINEVVKGDPDTATVGAGVTTRADTAVAAMRQNAAEMSKVIARLKALGVDAKDIQTSGISLNPRYNYDRQNNNLPEFLGYDASNQVTVTLRKLDKVGEVLDSLVEAGATNLNGPNFTLEDDAAAKALARKTAFARAQSQAGEYAAMAGYSGLRLLEISEAFTGSGPVPFAKDAIMVTGSRVQNSPVEPGQVGTGVTVTVKFELTR